jgi:hypothetical protein
MVGSWKEEERVRVAGEEAGDQEKTHQITVELSGSNGEQGIAAAQSRMHQLMQNVKELEQREEDRQRLWAAEEAKHLAMCEEERAGAGSQLEYRKFHR